MLGVELELGPNISNMSLLLGLEPFQKFGMGGGGWSKGILEFCFRPNLGLILEAGTKLSNIVPTINAVCLSQLQAPPDLIVVRKCKAQ